MSEMSSVHSNSDNFEIKTSDATNDSLNELFDVVNGNMKHNNRQKPFTERHLPQSFFNPPTRALGGQPGTHYKAFSSPATLEETNRAGPGCRIINHSKQLSLDSQNESQIYTNDITNINSLNSKSSNSQFKSKVTLDIEVSKLPDGFEMAIEDDKVYFLDHNTRQTTWFDPRLPEEDQKWGMGVEELTELHIRYLNNANTTSPDSQIVLDNRSSNNHSNQPPPPAQSHPHHHQRHHNPTLKTSSTTTVQGTHYRSSHNPHPHHPHHHPHHQQQQQQQHHHHHQGSIDQTCLSQPHFADIKQHNHFRSVSQPVSSSSGALALDPNYQSGPQQMFIIHPDPPDDSSPLPPMNHPLPPHHHQNHHLHPLHSHPHQLHPHHYQQHQHQYISSPSNNSSCSNLSSCLNGLNLSSSPQMALSQQGPGQGASPQQHHHHHHQFQILNNTNTNTTNNTPTTTNTQQHQHQDSLDSGVGQSVISQLNGPIGNMSGVPNNQPANDRNCFEIPLKMKETFNIDANNELMDYSH